MPALSMMGTSSNHGEPWWSTRPHHESRHQDLGSSARGLHAPHPAPTALASPSSGGQRVLPWLQSEGLLQRATTASRMTTQHHPAASCRY